MRGLKVVLIIFALIVFSASASALSLPSQLSSLMSFPTSFTTSNPTDMFSSGLTGYSPDVSIPSTGISSVSPTISDTSLIPAITVVRQVDYRISLLALIVGSSGQVRAIINGLRMA